METFLYKATNNSGVEEIGKVEAANQADAVAKIRRMGLFPTKVENLAEKQAAYSKKNMPADPEERRRRRHLIAAGAATVLYVILKYAFIVLVVIACIHYLFCRD